MNDCRLILICDLILLGCGLLLPNLSYSQVVLSSNIHQEVEGSISVRVCSDQTDKPVSFASVYIVPSGDTLISSFTLTDSTGFAKLKHVTKGTYNLHVEMLGFQSFTKVVYFYGEDVILGDIVLNENIQMLEEAHITALGKPVVFLKDTVVFNASAFSLGSNAMLEDILRLMPGITINENAVFYNGVPVSRITVGGHTFFFDDQSTALKNLPAQIISKIKIIDRPVADIALNSIKPSSLTIMDVELHDEFKKGWFGSIRASGGLSIKNRADSSASLRRTLYHGDLMFSAYGEKNQLTVIGGGWNAPLPSSGDKLVSNGDGLHADRQAGINYNTQQIKGFDVTGMIMVKRGENFLETRENQISFIPSAKAHSYVEELTTKDERKISFIAELEKNNTPHIHLSIVPKIDFFKDKQSESILNNHFITDDETIMASSLSSTSAEVKGFDHSLDLLLELNDYKKRGRSILFKNTYSGLFFNREEYLRASSDNMDSMPDRQYYFVKKHKQLRNLLRITFIEPFSDNWALLSSTSSSYSFINKNKEAFYYEDLSQNQLINFSKNTNLSFLSERKELHFDEKILFRYRKGEFSIRLGAQANVVYYNNFVMAGSSTTNTNVKKGFFDYGPYLDLGVLKKDDETTLTLSSSRIFPNENQCSETIDPTISTSLLINNTFLKPGVRHSFFFLRQSNTHQWNKTQSLSYSGDILTSDIVNAIWFDEKGTRIQVPVNSQRPSYRTAMEISRGFALTNDLRFIGDVQITASIMKTDSYQNKSRWLIVDIDNFTYADFMSLFWGNSSGDSFYSGKSGFKKSRTIKMKINPFISISYRTDYYNIRIETDFDYEKSWYEIDNTANTNTIDLNIKGYGKCVLSNRFEVSTSFAGYLYFGDSADYLTPHVNWNGCLTYNLNSFSVSLAFNDLFNTNKSYFHSINSNSIIYRQYNNLGRHFYITFKYSFGKLNANKYRNARKASMLIIE